jgi:sugar diacid utilization regulator
LREDGVFKRIWNERGVVRVSYAETDPGYHDRLVVAVRAGDEPLGSIWVQEGACPLGPEAEQLIEEAAGLAALHLVRHIATATQRSHESELVQAALRGRIPVTSLAGVMGVDSETRLKVLTLRPVGSESAAAAITSRLLSACNLYRRTSTVPMVAAASGALVHVVLPTTGRADAVVDDIVQRVRAASPMPVVAALAIAGVGVDAVVAARAEADEVAEASNRITASPLTLEEMHGPVALLRIRRAAVAMPQLLHGRLDALVELDERKDSQYLPTIRAFLDCFGDVVAAAASLGVHPNTFRYRLRRAVELAGLDVDDPVERVVAHLQLLLLAT